MGTLAQPQPTLKPDTLLATMLRPDVRVGMSTPKADPSGDCAWALFAQADAVQPGARAQLEAKALKLTGGPSSPVPPPGRNPCAWVMAERQADVFLTDCTNAVAAYGLTVRTDAPPAAQAFAQGLLEAPAQTVFKRLGFQSP